MKFEIEALTDGYVLRQRCEDLDGENLETSYAYKDLYEILSHLLGELELGNRYSDSRIYVIKAPGDKNEKFTEAHAQVIWGEE